MQKIQVTSAHAYVIISYPYVIFIYPYVISTYPYVIIGACMAAGSPLPTANTLATNLTMRFLRVSIRCTMIPLRKAITSTVPPPAARGQTN